MHSAKNTMTYADTAASMFGVVTWLVATVVAVSESVTGMRDLTDTTMCLLALGPGCLGGLAMQLKPAKTAGRRQIAAEILFSGAAGAIAAGLLRDSIDDVFLLGGLCFCAGAGGSSLIEKGIKLLQTKVGAMLGALFGIENGKERDSK